MQMNPDEFWSLTPAEFSIKAKGFIEGRKKEQQHDLYIAWHIQEWMRNGAPEWKSIVNKLNEDHKEQEEIHEQTPQAMLAMAKMITVATGGTVVEI